MRPYWKSTMGRSWGSDSRKSAISPYLLDGILTISHHTYWMAAPERILIPCLVLGCFFVLCTGLMCYASSCHRPCPCRCPCWCCRFCGCYWLLVTHGLTTHLFMMSDDWFDVGHILLVIPKLLSPLLLRDVATSFLVGSSHAGRGCGRGRYRRCLCASGQDCRCPRGVVAKNCDIDWDLWLIMTSGA